MNGERVKYAAVEKVVEAITRVPPDSSEMWRGDSGVATQGHAGARALATSGRAPATIYWPRPAGAALLIANRALNGLEIEQRSIAMYNTELRVSNAHHTRVCRK